MKTVGMSGWWRHLQLSMAPARALESCITRSGKGPLFQLPTLLYLHCSIIMVPSPYSPTTRLELGDDLPATLIVHTAEMYYQRPMKNLVQYGLQQLEWRVQSSAEPYQPCLRVDLRPTWHDRLHAIKALRIKFSQSSPRPANARPPPRYSIL